MADEQEFAEFIRRIRAGDEQAASDLVRRYETTIRFERERAAGKSWPQIAAELGGVS